MELLEKVASHLEPKDLPSTTNFIYLQLIEEANDPAFVLASQM
jgi:hypothetical protein